MLEITGDHVSLLNDEDLRTLIGLLCEAEARRGGFSPLGVTWGGDQNAADGGLDVRATLQGDVGPQLNLPRSLTGFQVKAQDMPRAAILAEMKPRGTVRSVIRALAEASGAYIIVSSKGSVSDTALNARHKAMAEVVRELPNVCSLHLDFYDRNRVASWVREYLGLAIWLREKVGRAVPGWRPYGPWAATSESPNAEYFLDETLRVCGRDEQGKSFSAIAGIQHIRINLSREQKGQTTRAQKTQNSGDLQTLSAKTSGLFSAIFQSCGDGIYYSKEEHGGHYCLTPSQINWRHALSKASHLRFWNSFGRVHQPDF